MQERITFSTTTEIVSLPADSLVFVSADGNYSIFTMANEEEFVITKQLGEVEEHIASAITQADTRFVRIGRSLIVNRDFITYVSPQKKKLFLSDCRSFRYELTASAQALSALKSLMDKEATI